MSTIDHKLTSILDGLEERRQAALLAQLAHNLTVSAREAYGMESEGSEELRRYNEIQHLVTAHVCALLRENERRYPNQALVDAIVERTGNDATGLRLRERVEWALSLALNQNRLQ